MRVSVTSSITGLLFAFFVSITGSAVIADDARVCASIAGIRAYQTGSNADVIMLQLDELLGRLKWIAQTNGNTKGVAQDLQAAILTLDRATGQSTGDAAKTAQNLDRNLPSILRLLARIEPVFGCQQEETVSPEGVQKPPSTRTHMQNGAQSLRGVAMPVTIVTSLMAAIAVIAIAAMGLRWGLRDRATRLVCRTPLLMVHGNNCTVTNILDINRSGMKVEAAPEHTDKMWFDLFFCGHKIKGQVRWKNAFFAGICFKSKISPQMLTDVINKSRKSVADSGLPSKATPCFSIGCHTTCPHHQSTAISQQKNDAHTD